jgi:hypothetical protein
MTRRIDICYRFKNYSSRWAKKQGSQNAIHGSVAACMVKRHHSKLGSGQHTDTRILGDETQAHQNPFPFLELR